MEIDFEKIEVYTDLDKSNKITANVRKEFANIVYQNGQGIAFHALALKIWNGEKQYSDEEYELIMKIAEVFYTPCFIDALRDMSYTPFVTQD